MGALYAISTFATASVVEKYGRKKLLLIGLGGMCLLTIALTVFTVLFVSVIVTSRFVNERRRSQYEILSLQNRILRGFSP